MLFRTVCMIIFMFLTQPAWADAFSNYRSIQKELTAADVTGDTSARVRALFPDAADLHALIDAAANEDKRRYIRVREQTQKAYVAFVKQPARADILLAFILDRLAFLESIPATDLPGSIIAWSWAYLGTAAVIGYEATGDQQFIDTALRIFRYAYRNTDEARHIKDGFGHDDLRGWSFSHHGKSAREPTMAGRIIGPMLRLAIAIKDKDDLPEALKSEIRQHASTGVEILRTYLKYQVRDGNKRYFLYVFTGEEDAFNHIAAYAQAAGYAYKLTGDQEFRTFCDGFVAYFVSHVTTGENGAYYWDYQILSDPKTRYLTMFWKAAIEVPALVNMQSTGIEIESKHRIGFVRSFTQYVLRKHRTVNAKLGSEDFPMTGYNLMLSDYTNAQTFSHFTFLDRWAPAVRNDILETIAARMDLFPEGLLATHSSAVAYAHMLKHP